MPDREPANPDSQAVFDVLSAPAPPDPAKVHNAVEAVRNMAGKTIAGALDAHRAELAAKIDAQNAKFDAKFDAQSAKFDAQNAQFDARFDSLRWMLMAVLALLAALTALGFVNWLIPQPPAPTAAPVVMVQPTPAPATPVE